jgi:endo-alpha-1,4-polygalactosaminidase (GH114 family)
MVPPRFKKMLLPSEDWKDLVIDENEVFQSFRVDVKHEAWKRWVGQEVMPLLERGLDGIFLDTIDTIDRYASRER